jgi:M6 family metalloprotease-like protein
MLVIYVQFTDVTYPTGLDAAYVANRFFGPFPSVANYFADDSFGRLILSPAAETDASNNGAVNDGVVAVTIASTKAAFTALSAGAQNKQILQAADPSVNFAAFDADSNGAITDDELVVERLDADPDPPGPAGCGATRGVDAVSLDGKGMSVSVAMDGTDSNLMTIIHETGHVAFHMRDLYGFGVGSFDISGPTCGYGDAVLFRTSTWQKLHIGWIVPTVVVQDGYYNVDRAATTGASYILYDPDKGTNDYFVVENRAPIPNTYDRNASDTGLVIWRIDDAQYNSASESVRPIDLMRPDGTTTPGCTGGCYGGSSTDAWNPTDANTPQRTMNRTWRDGAAAKVAVRAICPSGSVMRAYFDVRGPGVLVDPMTATCTPLQITVTPEEANPVSFTVMNTGETSDSFNFTVVNLPGGWTATTDGQTLGASTGSVANPLVTVPADAPVSVFTVKARGVSATDATVASEVEFTLRVVLHQTGITYSGATSVPYGEPANFQAQLSDITDPSDTIAGATVTFTLSDGVNTLSATALTDGTGLAVASPILTVPPGNYNLTISSARSGKHDAAATSVAYTVERRPTTLVYTGDLTADYSDPAAVTAVLSDTLSGAPLGGQLVTFTLGTQSASATTDANGLAAATIVIDQPAGNVTLNTDFGGDTFYLPSSDSDPFTITKESLTFVYTGDTLVALGTTPTLASQATEEADGSPGDLSRAEAKFHLEPTLTTTAFDYTTGVDVGGHSSSPASGLPVDVWAITISVPDSNPYWQGTSIVPAELVLYDPAASIAGGGHGSDTNSSDVSVTLTGRYHSGTPKGEVQVRASVGRFKGDQFAWIVVAGNQAIFQMQGKLNNSATILRLRLRDSGEPGIGQDTFSARIADLSGTTVYDSGLVVLSGGNLQVLKP